MTAPGPVPSGAALVVLTPGGLALARRLTAVLPGARIHGLEGRTHGSDHEFRDTGDHLRTLFTGGVPIVGICAAGILVRSLAPSIGEKGAEPPVVAVAEDGSAAVPLLGGHRGANRLARAVAAETGGVAAVTTASDSALGVALDDPPPGWRVANPGAVKDVTAAWLAGEPVALLEEAGDAAWLRVAGARFSPEGRRTVRVTDRRAEAEPGDLVLHPPVLALGVGCERRTEPDELIGLVEETLDRHRLAAAAVACVVSIDLKADEEAVEALARRLDVPARFFTAAELEAEAARLANPSATVFREVGCHGVAEGAALAAAGSDADLVVEKTRSARATCALARAPGDIDPACVGRARGRLAVVGLGPGARAWRTGDASAALAQATDVVGYELYLRLAEDILAGKALHPYRLGEEEERARTALELAAGGRSVALVSSGDPGIYALAALVFELMEREGRADWNRVAVTVHPGISALQAAAAAAGAPLGHDFCAISLSDLLTPWEEIEARLWAAAEADFVVALYNPVSKRRRRQLDRARDVLLTCRPPGTPVVIARNLGRPGESIRTVRLDELSPETADMVTVILVGSSKTRSVELGAMRRVYTPRGYDVGGRDDDGGRDIGPRPAHERASSGRGRRRSAGCG